jgi:hypothetical protein
MSKEPGQTAAEAWGLVWENLARIGRLRFIAVETAIRADERERCVKIVENGLNEHIRDYRTHILVAAIRAGEKP